MPKMGQDIAFEMGSDVRIESSKADIMLGMLSIFGASNEKVPLKVGGDIKIINRWYSDLKVVSLEYALVDETGKVASGSAKIDPKSPFVITAHTQRNLPLLLQIDTSSLNPARLMAMTKPSGKVTLKGEAVVQVWGKELRYPFERDAKKIFEKVSPKRLAL